jgi:hypothetical protein
MNISKLIVSAAFVAAATATASAAMATPVILGSSTGSISPNLTFTAGTSFTGSDPGATYKDRTTNTSSAVAFSFTAGTLGSFNSATDTQSFTGGSFSYGTLLSGTFGSGTLTLTGTDPVLGDTFSFVSTNTTFTGGTDQHGYTTGTFQLEAINAFDTSGGTNIVTSTGFNSFTATDGVTINAIPATPEPSAIAPFVLGGLGLLALGLRARKASAAVA